MLASEPVMLRVGRQISSRSNLFWIYNADRITTEKQSWNALMAWPVIITIAQWLDIFSSKISTHLNSKKKKKSQQSLVIAAKTLVTIRWFFFFFFFCLLVFLPKRLFPWLACLMMKWSISGHLASHCVFETPQGKSGQLFWLKTYLVCWAELKELPVGDEPFFAHVRTHVSKLTVVIAWWVYRELRFWTDGLSSSSYWSWL